MRWIEGESQLAMARQCALAGVARSSFYARGQEREHPTGELEAMRLIDEEYTRHPFYGSRRMVVFLARQGITANRERVQRLMRTWAWRAWRRGRPRAGRTPSTASTPTCCAA